MEQDIKTVCYVENELMPTLTRILKKSDVGFKYTIALPKDAYFLSNIFLLDIKFHDDNQEKHLAVKLPAVDKTIFHQFQCDVLFANEILFYKKYAKYCESCPNCYYTVNNPPDDFVIVLDDVSKLGFKMSDTLINVKMDYVFCTMRNIAKFHAKGYILKDANPEEFFNVVKDIHNIWDDSHPNGYSWKASLMNTTSLRPVSNLRARNYDSDFCDKVEKILQNALQNVLISSLEPVEPFATLCHGDVTMNNLLFKRDGDELHSLFIDFAQITYSSPAIDITTFLYLSCSREDLKECTIDIIKFYHDVLYNELSKAKVSNLQNYVFDAFLNDYKRCALFGYVIAVMFLPVMYGYASFEKTPKDPTAAGHVRNKEGGEKMSNMFGDMLIDMKELGLLSVLV